MRNIAASWLIGMLICTSVFAQSEPHEFFYFGINYQVPTYPEPLASRATFARRAPGMKHIPIHADAGYYRQKGNLTMIGGVLQTSIDRYSAYGESLQIESYQPSFSLVHYIDGRVGTGLFARIDAGPAFHRVTSNARGTENRALGWGYLLGGGVSMAFRSSYVMASAHYARKSVKGDTYSFFSFGLGIMIRKI